MTHERERVPPGQGVTTGWPVLHVGAAPALDAASWTLLVDGAVEAPLIAGLDEFRSLPRVAVEADFHCVTGWSRLDLAWEGVSVAALLDIVGADAGASHVRFADGGAFDTVVPLDVARRADTLLADTVDGAPLERLHGGPVRAVVPRLYGWKSCKWVRRVEVLEAHRYGFWELRGYHDRGDPWREERLV